MVCSLWLQIKPCTVQQLWSSWMSWQSQHDHAVMRSLIIQLFIVQALDSSNYHTFISQVKESKADHLESFPWLPTWQRPMLCVLLWHGLLLGEKQQLCQAFTRMLRKSYCCEGPLTSSKAVSAMTIVRVGCVSRLYATTVITESCFTVVMLITARIIK